MLPSTQEVSDNDDTFDDVPPSSVCNQATDLVTMNICAPPSPLVGEFASKTMEESTTVASLTRKQDDVGPALFDKGAVEQECAGLGVPADSDWLMGNNDDNFFETTQRDMFLRTVVTKQLIVDFPKKIPLEHFEDCIKHCKEHNTLTAPFQAVSQALHDDDNLILKLMQRQVQATITFERAHGHSPKFHLFLTPESV